MNIIYELSHNISYMNLNRLIITQNNKANTEKQTTENDIYILVCLDTIGMTYA